MIDAYRKMDNVIIRQVTMELHVINHALLTVQHQDALRCLEDVMSAMKDPLASFVRMTVQCAAVEPVILSLGCVLMG